MNVELDMRPSSDKVPHPFFAIRLFPETNEEMGKMEWGINVMGQPNRIARVFNGTGGKTFHYVICFEERGKTV